MSTKSNYIITILCGTLTIFLISIYNNKLQLKDFREVRFPISYNKPNSFKSRPPVYAPLWYEDNNQSFTSTDKPAKSQEKPKLILIYTTWYGQPSWFYSWQAVDKKKIFYSLETENFSCPKKCLFTHNLTYLNTAELVVASVVDVPSAPEVPSTRPNGQIWAAFICESPINQNVRHHLGAANNLFNWSVSYRLDSDVYWPSGHFYKFKNPQARDSYLRLHPMPTKAELKKKKFAAWVVSNCQTYGRREMIVSQMKKFMDIDVYGACGSLQCPKEGDCREYLSSRYKFYLSFENSLCLDYVTEKFFDALGHSMIPITYGLGTYSKVAPPHSYINILEYNSIKELADYLHYLDRNDDEYLKYFEWKRNYTVLNDPTMSGLCNLCVHLWENGNATNTYEDFDQWWTTKPVDKEMTKIQKKYLHNLSGVCSHYKQLNISPE